MNDYFSMNELGENEEINKQISFQEQITNLSIGLLYPSESDYELSYFSIDEVLDAPINLIQFRKLTGNTPKTFAESLDAAVFFDKVITEQDWWTDYEKNRSESFQKIKALFLSNLSHIEFIKIGKTEIQAYLIGKTIEGKWEGFKTILIET